MGRDIHVLRYFSSFISISDGKVINVTDPVITSCPLASHLYKGLKDLDDPGKEKIKKEIGKVIESKIRDYGFFTSRRDFSNTKTAILFGASEMLMAALDKKVIDATVVVCDGAGTVITDNGSVVQGIGARMNSLLLTSPVPTIMERLKENGCEVVFENALIDQARGVERAVKSGHENIAVTVTGHDSDKLESIRSIEASSGRSITILSVCNTGINGEKIDKIARYADIVWSCASQEIRREIGKRALAQISTQIPVFVLTKKGLEFVAAYAHKLNPRNFFLLRRENETR